MAKRTKENALSASWSKKEKDIIFNYPNGTQTKCDGHFLHSRFDIAPFRHDGTLDVIFIKELEERGYDISTLRFSICKKEDHPRWKL